MDIKQTKKEYKNQRNILKREYKGKKIALKSQYLQTLDSYYVSAGKAPRINPPKRSALEEIGNSVSHLIGSIFAVVAMVLMFCHSQTPAEWLGASVYSVGLFVMFTMSCMYHAFPYGSSVKRLFRRFDYLSIYLLIGATFAPILLCFVGGTFGGVFFIVQWAIIAVGIILVAVFGPTRYRRLHIPLYLILGWSGLLFIPKMLAESPGLFAFVLGGGIVYSLGVIPFAIKTRVAHFIWHFFVLAGAVIQWLGIYMYIYLPVGV